VYVVEFLCSAGRSGISNKDRGYRVAYLAVDNIGKKLDKPVELDAEDDAYIGVDTEINGIKCKGSYTFLLNLL